MAFAPDYKGTIEAGLLDAVGASAPSVWQQTAGSAFVTALQNAGGLNEIIPTTNLYSATDDIVQPQVTNSPLDSSYLFNGKNIQAQSVCGPLFIIDHAGSLTSQFSYVVGKSALASSTGKAQSSGLRLEGLQPAPCDNLTAQQKLQAEGLLLVAGANLATGPKQNCEPDLMPTLGGTLSARRLALVSFYKPRSCSIVLDLPQRRTDCFSSTLIGSARIVVASLSFFNSLLSPLLFCFGRLPSIRLLL